MSQLPPGFVMDGAAPPRQFPGVIQGVPDPLKQAQEARAQEDQVMQRETNARAQRQDARAQAEFDAKYQTLPAPGDSTKTGEDYLTTLHPDLAAQVRALAEGRRAFPTGAALRSPQMQELIAAASQYDPTLDAANAATRVTTRKDFTSGKAANNVTAINTALGHLGSLADAAGALDNSSFRLWNTVGNATATEFGDRRVKNFTLARDAVANELMKVFRGTGGSVSEIQEWQKNIDAADSPEQLKATITQATGLLRSRLESMNDQYSRGMGKSGDPLNLLSPHAQQIYNYITGSTDPLHYVPLAGGIPPASGGAGGQPPVIGGGGPPNPPPLSPADPQMQAATGDSRRVQDPAMTAQIDQMLRKGAPLAAINGFLGTKGLTPITDSDYGQARDFLKQHPDYQGSIARAWRLEPLSGFEKAVTSLGNNAAGAYLVNAGQFLSGNTLDNLAPDPARARAAMDAVSAQHPLAAPLGQVSGAMMASGLGELGLARAGVGNALARGYMADAAMGAANGAGAADGPNQSRGLNALAGAGAAAAGNAAGGLIVKGIKGVSSPAINALRQADIPMTIGQAFGQSGKVGAAIKGLEDRAAGLPVVGDMINARRREGIERFNQATFAKALEPIGGQIKGKVGEDAIAEAQQQVSAAFTSALAGKAAVPDKAFSGQFTSALNQAAQIPRLGSEVLDEIVQRFKPYDKEPALTGEMMQQISRELQSIKTAYKNDPLAQRINKAVNSVDDALLGMFDRQFAGTVKDYGKAREAYRKVSVLQDAVLAADNTGGVFTPAQLGRADKRNAVKYSGKNAAAAGNRQFGDLQRPAQDILPNKVPDSGTAGRLVLPALAIGAGGASDQSGLTNGTGLTLGLIVAGAYSKVGQRVLTKGARGAAPGSLLRNPATQKLITAGGAATATAATQ